MICWYACHVELAWIELRSEVTVPVLSAMQEGEQGRWRCCYRSLLVLATEFFVVSPYEFGIPVLFLWTCSVPCIQYTAVFFLLASCRARNDDT